MPPSFKERDVQLFRDTLGIPQNLSGSGWRIELPHFMLMKLRIPSRPNPDSIPACPALSGASIMGVNHRLTYP